ncbi:MAG: two-component system sensor histidine kinase/response regulator [Phenylobacterium sp.]|jgi:two-component system sensor histidine kinase/response regulator
MKLVKPVQANMSHLRASAWLTSTFVLLAVILELILAVYWSSDLVPRLKSQAINNAYLQAQSQALGLAQILSMPDDAATPAQYLMAQQLQGAFDRLLLLKDPLLDEAFFVGLSLEVDYDGVPAKLGSLDFTEGNIGCSACFATVVQLYSPQSDELLGLATFYVSDAFFINLKTQLKESFIVVGGIVLILLLLVWMVVMTLVVHLFRQIEQRKKTEQALLIAKEQAEAANESRGLFLANMSHEIRTPMNVIIGLCDIVLKTDLSDNQQEYLSKVHLSAHLLLGLLNDILDCAKIESGKMSIENIEFGRDEVLDNLAQMIMPKAAEKGLSLVYDVAANVPAKLMGDPFRLGQILLNLLNNAIKFTERGEIVLLVKQVEKQNHRMVVQFSVKDTGIGIESEAGDKLFSSFTQADSSMSRKYGGSGLGLTICKELVGLMQGEIWFDSEPDLGSTFHFTVAFNTEDIKPISLTEYFSIPSDMLGTKVLVVSASEASRMAYCQMLSWLGFAVESQDSASKALAHWQQHYADNPYQLVILDWQPDNRDCLKLAHQLKNKTSASWLDEDAGQKPLLLMVGDWVVGDIFAPVEPYLDAKLIKPASLSALYNSLAGLFYQFNANVDVGHADVDNAVAAALPASNFTDKTVLLVEDNEMSQLIAEHLLNEVQLKVDCAVNALMRSKKPRKPIMI